MGFSQRDDATARCRGTFPLFRDTGAASTAAVYFELEPGDHLGRHVDSAEEVLVVLEGTVEASVGEETARAGAGALVLVPAMTPHDVRNVGDRTARVTGIFSANTMVAVFDEPYVEVGSRVVGTPPPAAAAEPVAA